MATAGYLISRAAERPAVLSLMVAIVAVRFFGLGRPVIRYLERLASHDAALRVLGRVRTQFYERIEPLAPAQLDCYREGDLLSRMVADVDALQNLYLRGLGPALVAVLAGAVSVGAAAAFLPAAALVLGGRPARQRCRGACAERWALPSRGATSGGGARPALGRARAAGRRRAGDRRLRRRAAATGRRPCGRSHAGRPSPARRPGRRRRRRPRADRLRAQLSPACSRLRSAPPPMAGSTGC